MATVTVSKSVKLQAGAAEVWQFVSDFSGFASWQPQIKSVEMLPNGDRRVFFTRGDSILDRVTRLDVTNRTFTYGLVPGQPTPPGAPPIKQLDATFVVTEIPNGSEVTYTVEADLPDAMKDMAQVGIGGDIDAALAALAKRFNQ